MREYLSFIEEWLSRDIPFALARVIRTWGSAPRPVGSVMLINQQGEMAGSVSGGCVEGSVVKVSRSIFVKKEAQKLEYGVSDEDAWTVGLSCGGNISIFLQPFFEDEIGARLIQSLKTNTPCVLVTRLDGEKNENTLVIMDKEGGSYIGDPLNKELEHAALEAYDQRTHKTIEKEEGLWFIHVFPRRSQLIMIGAAHITADLVELGHLYDFETIVIDPRGAFTQNTAFKVEPDRVLEAYPSEVLQDFSLDAYTYCAVLSHDPKIDDNALEILLPSKVAYIGALGSRKTHARRLDRLQEKGLTKELTDRIHAPIGLSINAKSAREIALSVMGEIIQVKNQYM